jgi:hypothetical protein
MWAINGVPVKNYFIGYDSNSGHRRRRVTLCRARIPRCLPLIGFQIPNAQLREALVYL